MPEHEEPPHVRHRPRQWSEIEYTVTRVLQQVCERETTFVSPSRTPHGDTLVRILFRCGLRSDKSAGTYPPKVVEGAATLGVQIPKEELSECRNSPGCNNGCMRAYDSEDLCNLIVVNTLIGDKEQEDG